MSDYQRLRAIAEMYEASGGNLTETEIQDIGEIARGGEPTTFLAKEMIAKCDRSNCPETVMAGESSWRCVRRFGHDGDHEWRLKP